MGATEQLVKPKLRGVFHELGFYTAAAVGVVMVVTADPGRARVSGAIFAGCVAGCFGTSAVYHRPMWRPRASNTQAAPSSPPTGRMLAAVKTYDVQLVQPDGTSGAGKYESPTGELPNVGDLIEVDEHGTRARVTDIWSDDSPPIRAELSEQ